MIVYWMGSHNLNNQPWLTSQVHCCASLLHSCISSFHLGPDHNHSSFPFQLPFSSLRLARSHTLHVPLIKSIYLSCRELLVVTFSIEIVILSVRRSYCHSCTHSWAASEYTVSLDDIQNVRETSVKRSHMWGDRDGKMGGKILNTAVLCLKDSGVFVP